MRRYSSANSPSITRACRPPGTCSAALRAGFAPLRAANAARDAALAAYEQTVLEAFAQVDDALQALVEEPIERLDMGRHQLLELGRRPVAARERARHRAVVTKGGLERRLRRGLGTCFRRDKGCAPWRGDLLGASYPVRMTSIDQAEDLFEKLDDSP